MMLDALLLSPWFIFCQTNMPKVEALLEDGLRSELILKQQLKSLSETLRQQLQEAEKRQTAELETRIHQNALLSTDIQQRSGDKKEVNCQTKWVFTTLFYILF